MTTLSLTLYKALYSNASSIKLRHTDDSMLSLSLLLPPSVLSHLKIVTYKCVCVCV